MSAKRIIDGLTDALRWVRGEGTLRVTIPGQGARRMKVEDVIRNYVPAQPKEPDSPPPPAGEVR